MLFSRNQVNMGCGAAGRGGWGGGVGGILSGSQAAAKIGYRLGFRHIIEITQKRLKLEFLHARNVECNVTKLFVPFVDVLYLSMKKKRKATNFAKMCLRDKSLGEQYFFIQIIIFPS